MRSCRWLVIGCWLSLSGCVLGYGRCLLLEPVKHTLTGRVHFRDFPAADGVDNVPILILDKTAYLYAPAQSHSCLGANDVQLVGVSEFPATVVENTHVSVDGTLSQQVSAHEYTPFLLNVTLILPLNSPR